VSSAQKDEPARRQPADGAKRSEIIAAATERFARDGYNSTKWADIATDVGVGPTALYHYFGSKQHCLFVILDEAAQDALERFERAIGKHSDPAVALHAVVADAFDVTPREVQRLRVLVAEHGLLAVPRKPAREEQARQLARARTRALDVTWATLLARAMERGVIPEGDARLLARAVLGLYNSIWQWFRPDGPVAFSVMSDFFRIRMLELLGVGSQPDEAAVAA
jgi:AcrR family transcriptional regulator